jgi:hypothetical protein
MKKLLIALQFYSGDAACAWELARLMADLETSRRKDVDFLFVSRFDARHDWSTIRYVSRKFNVATFTGRRTGVGWPAGCNDLWHDLVDFLTEGRRNNLMPEYEAVLTCEADCIPLYRDWVSRLSTAWRERTPGAVIAGHLVTGKHLHPHINGNLMLSGSLPDLQRVQKLRGSPPSIGWDYYHAAWFKRAGWAAIPEIVSYHAFHDWSDKVWSDLRKRGCVFFHGVKRGEAFPTVRDKLLSPRLDKPSGTGDTVID